MTKVQTVDSYCFGQVHGRCGVYIEFGGPVLSQNASAILHLAESKFQNCSTIQIVNSNPSNDSTASESSISPIHVSGDCIDFLQWRWPNVNIMNES